MYSYTWDAETGGLLLNSSPLSFSKEPRPVYYKELDILGFDRYWNYAKNDSYPYMWAEANNYFYRGRQVAKTKGGSLYTPPEIVIMDEPEPDGQPLRFVDIPAMVEKNRDLLEKLAAETIKKIYNIYVEYMDRVDVFYVAFSGGKDSVVALDLVQRALPHNKFKVLFGDTGMEFPDTYKIVEEIEQHCKDAKIEFLRAKSDFDPKVTWREFGPPAQTMRWCCSVHKTAPQIILLREYTNNPHFRGMAFTGIRGDESASRSEYEGISHGEKVRGQYSCHPILEWNSAELFSYIYERQLLINDAYKKGNSRAGCLVCPLATSKNMYFKEQAYSFSDEGYRTTTTFNNIILETTSKELSNPSAVKEFMDIGGWKARRSGKELSFAKSYTNESFEGYDYSREDRKLPIHLIRELELIDELLKKIKTNLTNGDYQKAILIADHGASRLAVIHGTENLWEMQSSGKHSGRCCPKSEVDERPDSATDAEDFWALANYDRFKGSRKANVEVHGGATLEEVTVPIIEISYLNDAVEVKIMPIDSTATFTGIPEIFVSFRKKAAIKVFSTEKLVDVSVVIDGHTYEAKPTADNFYVVEEMTEIRRAKTYSVDVFAGGMPVATGLPLRVKKESGSEKNIL